MKIYGKNEYIENGFISATKKHINGDFPEHGHTFFEIEFILGGTGSYIVDGASYDIDKNMLFLLSPANIHSIKGCDAEIINIMFSCKLCSATSLYSFFKSGNAKVMKFSDEDAAFIRGLLNEIVTSQLVEYSETFLRCLLCKIASQSYDNSPKDNNYIQAAIIHILENFHTSLTLSKTAQYLSLAPSYFSSQFKKEMGIGYKEYLDNVRFEHALKLLKFTDMPVGEICTSSGFADYTNFTRRFKEKYHSTPTQYRQLAQSRM